jgi:hypothetical protein
MPTKIYKDKELEIKTGWLILPSILIFSIVCFCIGFFLVWRRIDSLENMSKTWFPITKTQPPHGILVDTCVMDGTVVTREMRLMRDRILWKRAVGLMVYHTPTHFSVDEVKKNWLGMLNRL